MPATKDALLPRSWTGNKFNITYTLLPGPSHLVGQRVGSDGGFRNWLVNNVLLTSHYAIYTPLVGRFFGSTDNSGEGSPVQCWWA
jgi:hypothetical protein